MRKKVLIFCIFFVTFGFFVRLNYSRQATVDIYIKSLKIWHLKEVVSINMSRCGFKTSRKKPTGLVSCEGRLLKRIDSAYIQAKLFYQYGTIYREYLFNYKRIEVCDLMANKRNFKYSNPLADIARAVVKNCCPQFDHECPYLPGWYNATNIDINATLAPLFPPIVPAGMIFFLSDRYTKFRMFYCKGQYKVYIRGYLENNLTAVEIVAIAIVKPNHANRAGEFSMLGMG